MPPILRLLVRVVRERAATAPAAASLGRYDRRRHIASALVLPTLLTATVAGGATVLAAQEATTGRLEVDGTGLHYRVLGGGPDTVLVPLGSVVGPVLEPLARTRTLVFYDMRGRGRSDSVVDPGRLGFDKDVEDLDAVRRHLGVGRVSVIGYSYLGAVAVRWALEHPGAVDRLALVAPLAPRAPHPDATGPDELAEILGPEGLELLRPPYGPEPSTAASCRRWWATVAPLYVGIGTDPGALLPDLDLGCDLSNERPDAFMPTLAAVLGGLGSYDWRAEARALRRPVLVVHGTDDRAAPPAGGREWAEAVADGHFEAVEGAGHFLLFERTDRVIGLLDAFLPGGP